MRERKDLVCCVCGSKYSCCFEGKPYCNKHYLRMKNNGTIAPKERKRTCSYTLDGDVLTIVTAKGETILADATDYDMLSKYSWCVSATGYPVAQIGGKVTKISRYIFGDACSGKVVDHINHNKLDNRRCNLRICTQAENAKNTSASKSSLLKELGIRITKNGKFNVRITVDRKQIHIGNYDTIEEARTARCEAEKKYFGKFASSRGENQ